MEDHYDDIKFTETDALSSDKLYDAKYLPFSEANGWCLRANSPRDIGHSQNASIDLGKNFLIYGMQVNGLYYKPHELQNRMKFAPKSFRFRYGVDVKNKANLEGKDVSIILVLFFQKQLLISEEEKHVQRHVLGQLDCTIFGRYMRQFLSQPCPFSQHVTS